MNNEELGKDPNTHTQKKKAKKHGCITQDLRAIHFKLFIYLFASDYLFLF